MENEIWKDIPGYENLYQVSNLGRVKSLERIVKRIVNNDRHVSERIMKLSMCGRYLQVGISKSANVKMASVHVLVAMAFLGHTPCGYKIVVDHINNDPLNNRVENLQIISHRENASKDRRGGSSEFPGVGLSGGKWYSKITLNKKDIYLGVFDTEEEANEYYVNALKAINNGDEIKIKRTEYTSKHRGISFAKERCTSKWNVKLPFNGKFKSLGYFPTEELANIARINFCVANNIKHV